MPQAAQRVRLVVLSDIGNEPDDTESMIRLLTYANELDIEALIATTSVWLKNTVHPEMMHSLIDKYASVRDQLSLHADGYPTGDALNALVSQGLPVFGLQGVGAGKDSAGSDALIAVVDRDDPRPVWVTAWGGPSVLAQALFKVQQSRSAEQLSSFVQKLRVYAISDQDDSGPWLRQHFPELFYIVSPSSPFGNEGYAEATWSGISGEHFYHFNGPDSDLVSNAWIAQNVHGHGALGDAYPEPPYIMEGDTPSFLYLIPNGLGAPERPDYGSWGGRYAKHDFWTSSADTVTGHDGADHTQNQATIWRWRAAYQNDFAARLDWCVNAKDGANHPPLAVLSGARERSGHSGEKLHLSANGSSDPDGDAVGFEWFVYPEAGTCPTGAAIEAADASEVMVTLPAATIPCTLHVIAGVTDAGSPPLTRYLRAIVNVTP